MSPRLRKTRTFIVGIEVSEVRVNGTFGVGWTSLWQLGAFHLEYFVGRWIWTNMNNVFMFVQHGFYWFADSFEVILFSILFVGDVRVFFLRARKWKKSIINELNLQKRIWCWLSWRIWSVWHGVVLIKFLEMPFLQIKSFYLRMFGIDWTFWYWKGIKKKSMTDT